MKSYFYLMLLSVFINCQTKGEQASSSEEQASSSEEIDLGNFDSYIMLNEEKIFVEHYRVHASGLSYAGFATSEKIGLIISTNEKNIIKYNIRVVGNMYSGKLTTLIDNIEKFTFVQPEVKDLYLAEKYKEPVLGITVGNEEFNYMSSGNGGKARLQKARAITDDKTIAPDGVIIGYLLSFENIKFIPYTSEESNLGQLVWKVNPEGKPATISGKIFLRDPDRVKKKS